MRNRIPLEYRSRSHATSYLEQALTALPYLAGALACLEREPRNRAALEEGYRHTATIGSIASKIEAPQLAHMAHGMEGVLGDVLDGFLLLDPPTLHLLEESLGQMQQAIRQLATRLSEAGQQPVGLGEGQVIDSTLTQYPVKEQGSAPSAEGLSRSTGGWRRCTERTCEEEGTNTTSRMTPEHNRTQSAPESLHRAERALVVIQKLQRERATGVLHIARGAGAMREEGVIRFARGQIIEALLGRWRGPEARNRMNQWGACQFVFQLDDPCV